MNKEMKLKLNEEETLNEIQDPEYFKQLNRANVNIYNRNTGNIDYAKSSLKELSEKEAKELWKTNPQNLVLVITDSRGNDRQVRFNENGKVLKDYYNSTVRGDWRFNVPYEDGFKRKNGDNTIDVFYMPINHMIEIAKKRYEETRVNKDTAQQAERRKNPESKYTTSDKPGEIRNRFSKRLDSADKYQRAVSRINSLSDDDIRKSNVLCKRMISEVVRNFEYSFGEVTAPYRYDFIDGTHDLRGWKDIFLRALRKWCIDDSDTQYAYLAYLYAKHRGQLSPDTYEPFTKENLINMLGPAPRGGNFVDKDVRAAIRYADVEDVLQGPKRRLQQSRGLIAGLERDVERAQNNKANYEGERSKRLDKIQKKIKEYKDTIKNYLMSLEGLEDKMDNFDAEDAKEVERLQGEIDKVVDALEKTKEEFRASQTRGSMFGPTFSNKVPESLEDDTTSLHSLLDD